MQLIIYPLLSTYSRSAILRTKEKYGAHGGQPYKYEIRGQTLQRLAKETAMTLTEVREQVIKEREYLKKLNSVEK